MKDNQWLFLFHDHFLCLDNQYAAGDVVPSTRKIEIYGPEFKSFVSIFQKIQVINMRFFLTTISHMCGVIKPPWGPVITCEQEALLKSSCVRTTSQRTWHLYKQ